MGWPKGRKRRAAHQERPINPPVDGRNVQDAQEGQRGLLRDGERGEVEGGSRVTSVESPRYAGVHVDHPSIVSAIKNMVKQGRRTEEIVRTIGMPREVVERYQREGKR